MPRVDSLRQNTHQWQKWRSSGLGSSDAPVVMGDSLWRRPRELWELKTGRRPEDEENPAMLRGRALEIVAREAYETYTGEQMEPHCFVHEEHPWMRASLDGISFDSRTILEIKCPLSRVDHISAKQGQVPGHYYAQLQHQLEVSRAERAHYWSFDGSAGVLVEVRLDANYARRLVEAEAAFWRLVVENCWPSVDEDELDLNVDPNWREAALRYREARLALERAAAEEQNLRALLDRMATARRTFGCGVELVRSSRKGAVDYSAFRSRPRGLPQARGRGPQNQPHRGLRGRWSFSAFETFASSSAPARRSDSPTIS